MKSTKKLASILLALVMLLAMAVPAFAETGTSAEKTGTITISNPVAGQTYTIYKMFELESFDADPNKSAYSYKITTDWEDFVKEGAAGATYFNVDAQGYVTLKTPIDNDSDTAAALAKAALEYANAKPIEPATGNQKTASKGDTTLEFTNLPLGYYLVDSSLGALCGLTTTKTDATIEEKNDVPSISKQVQEDSKVPEDAPGSSWGDSNTAEIGQTVYFKTVVKAKKGAQNYVVHDKMSNGFTLKENTITVVGARKNIDYTVTPNVQHYKKNVDGSNSTVVDYTCDFEITFEQTYLDTITADTDITITYEAVLNANAQTGTNTNTNETMLSYGDDSATAWVTTNTYTYEFDLVKTDSKNKVLDGAQFKLYRSATGTDEVALIKVNGVYRLATQEDIDAGISSAVIDAGKVTVKGLDSDTYYLEETKQPSGYNKLTGRVKVEINGANLKATMTADGTTWTDGGVHVVNSTGAELPSTGGIGTTIFYIVGGILLVGAGVLLVVRKRMSTAKESNK